MGTFQGHFLPGAFFVSIALWWTVQITRRVLFCKKREAPFYNTTTYTTQHGACLKWNTEGLVKIILTSVGISLELLASTEYGSAGKIVYIDDIQHVAMYTVFFISGVADILCHKDKLPPGTDYLIITLAFLSEALLFSNHLLGRSRLDTTVHTFLIYSVLAAVAAILWEFHSQTSMLAAYVRSYAVLLQGTWFIHVGIILYPPSPIFGQWKAEDHKDIMLAGILFVFHLVTDIVIIIFVAWVTQKHYWNCCPHMRGEHNYELVNVSDVTYTDVTSNPLVNNDEPGSCDERYTE